MPVAKPESSDARIIAHIDMDCFYVQVEQRKQPHLRGLPTAVVQYNSWKGGSLIAVSYEARKYGVKRSMRGDEAEQVCPQIQLVQVPVARDKADLNTYRNAGSEVVSVLARKGRCERASIDEVYLDLTDAAETMLADSPPESLEVIDEEVVQSHILGLNNEDGSDAKGNVKEWLCRSDADRRDKLLACGALIVAELRMQVLKETEFTCSAGVAHNKMLAKLASPMNKPAQQTVVPFSSVKGLLDSLPIKKMKQLGGKLGTSLQSDLGMKTVGDLLQFSEEKLQECYGINTGTWLWNIARGICGEEVQGRLLPKSHGSGKTFPGPRALRTINSVQKWLNGLCEDLSERLCSDLDQNKRIAHTLTLHASAYKSGDKGSHKKFPSKSCPLRYGTAKIQEDALNLFQAALREYLGSYKSKAQGSHYSGWGITSLSVSASKIVAIPSGTCSIMKYFHGQYSSCSLSKQSPDGCAQDVAPFSPSGSESYSDFKLTEPQIEFPGEETKSMYDVKNQDHQEERRISKEDQVLKSCSDSKLTEPQIEFLGEETKIMYDVTNLDRQEEKRISWEDQGSSFLSIHEAQVSVVQETLPPLPSEGENNLEIGQSEKQRDLAMEEAGVKYVMPHSDRVVQKRNKSKDKGTVSILRFFKSCDSSCTSRKQELAEAASSAGFQSTSSVNSEPNQVGSREILPEIMETNSSRSQREAWGYKVDEIDSSVVDELPADIQEEVRAWLRPQKRPNVVKKCSSIAHYFLPAKER